MNQVKPHHIVLLLIVVAAAIRILPHPLNLTPIGALALFSGAYIQRPIFWLTPLFALLLGDLLMGFYNSIVMLAVYVGFAASTLIGRTLLHGRVSPLRIAAGVGCGALCFWLISNFGSWLAFRPHTAAGLIACYVDGLPYLARSLIGDSIYACVLFGAYRLASPHAPRAAANDRVSAPLEAS